MQWKKKNEAAKSLKAVIEELSGYSVDALHNPPSRTIAGMFELALLFLDLKEGKKIFVVGDYDADGITSSTILSLIMDEMGIPYEVYIPRRMSDGYGFSEHIYVPDDCNVLITVDNGIAAAEPLRKIRESGRMVIVLDHHQQAGDLPEADILIDPEVTKVDEFTHYCGAGLSFKLAEMLFSMDAISKETFEWCTVLGAIGTVADVMPLVDENRKLVREGLALFPKWKALSELKLPPKCIAKDIGFKVGPMLNAMGRISDAGGQEAYQMIYASITKGTPIKKLIDTNERRKLLQKAVLSKVYEKIEPEMSPIIVLEESCPEGLVGPVAGKLAEKYRVPAFVFTKTRDGIVKGSARTYEDFDVKAFMDEHADLFLKYGGHVGAGGMSMTEESFEKLKKCTKPVKKEVFIFYDLGVEERYIPQVAKALSAYEPLGEGVPAPIFRTTIEALPDEGSHYKEMGSGTVKMKASGYEVIGFDLLAKYKKLGCPKKFEALGTIGRNYYKGKMIIQFELLDIKPEKGE